MKIVPKFTEPGQNFCNKGHPLVCYWSENVKWPYFNGGFTCSFCREGCELVGGDYVDKTQYHCAECKYDLCPKCLKAKPIEVCVTTADDDAGTPATKAHVVMILAHLGIIKYRFKQTIKALLIEAVDKCSNIERAVADSKEDDKDERTGGDEGFREKENQTWKGGFANGLKHGLCMYNRSYEAYWSNYEFYDKQENKFEFW